MKLLGVVTDCLPNIRTPALLQFTLVGLDQTFDIYANYALVGLIHHFLKDTKTVKFKDLIFKIWKNALVVNSGGLSLLFVHPKHNTALEKASLLQQTRRTTCYLI